jgi:hypothetical protein
MTLDSLAQALLQARRLLGLPASDADHAWRVRRLDTHGAYFIVHAAGHVVCMDAASGALLASTAAAHTPVHLTRDAALTAAALGSKASAELVWKPCAATLSIFDPLWFVASGHDSVFIDQRGKRWPILPTADAADPG